MKLTIHQNLAVPKQKLLSIAPMWMEGSAV